MPGKRPRPRQSPEPPDPSRPERTSPSRPQPVSSGPPDQTPTQPSAPEPAQPLPADLSGPELARAVLDAARVKRPPARRREPGAARRRPTGYSGPGPDPRDPQTFATILAQLVKSRGWQRPAAEATVFGSWERVVGPDVAAHSRPVKLENGELTVEAESTAWATQLRLLAPSLIRQIAGAVGHNVVTKLHIHGPAAPSWSRGPRRVRGRGPRDTYG